MKNLYLFIQINFIPFNVIPSRYIALMPTFFPIVETHVKFDFRNCLQSLHRFGLFFSIVSKRCPRSGLLSLGNSQKSHEAKSGEYGGCGTIYVEFLAKWLRRTSAVWDSALSRCKNHELSAQNIFWNGVEWSFWNTNSVSKVSNSQFTIFVH